MVTPLFCKSSLSYRWSILIDEIAVNLIPAALADAVLSEIRYCCEACQIDLRFDVSMVLFAARYDFLQEISPIFEYTVVVNVENWCRNLIIG